MRWSSTLTLTFSELHMHYILEYDYNITFVKINKPIITIFFYPTRSYKPTNNLIVFCAAAYTERFRDILKCFLVGSSLRRGPPSTIPLPLLAVHSCATGLAGEGTPTVRTAGSSSFAADVSHGELQSISAIAIGTDGHLLYD